MRAIVDDKGQTLVEMVIATGLVAFVLVALVAGATVGLRSARLSRERNMATKLATGELVKARQERDADPETFFGDAGVSGPTNSGTNPVYSITVTKTLNGSQMEVEALVEWTDGDKQFSVAQSTFLTKWL